MSAPETLTRIIVPGRRTLFSENRWWGVLTVAAQDVLAATLGGDAPHLLYASSARSRSSVGEATGAQGASENDFYRSFLTALAGVMDNPAPNQYRKKFGLGIKEVDGRVPTRPQYGFGTATREQSRMVFIARKDTYRASSKYLIRG